MSNPPRPEYSGLDLEALASLLDPGGALSRLLPGFEQRPEQVTMLRAVARAFADEQVLMVEAGTGVGKSLAYCLPAARYAQASGERVVISTGTINLQEQLVNKDLPLVGQALGRDVDFVLVKGRSNYLCQRRLADRLRQGSLLEPDPFSIELAALADWAAGSADGSRSDLARPVDPEVWEQVSSDPDACLGRKCPYREECFFARARARAAKAELLVVNHHLLFADLALRRESGELGRTAVLPEFDRLVLDEGHGLEDVASGFFGVQLTRLGALRALGRLAPARKSRGSGLLAELGAELSALGAPRAIGRPARRDRLDALVREARERVERAFDALVEFSVSRVPARGPAERRLRLTVDLQREAGWLPVREGVLRLAESAETLSGELAQLVDRLSGLSDEDGGAAEARGAVRRLQSMADACRILVDESQPELVRWAEWPARRDSRFARLAAAPLDVSGLLSEHLFTGFRTVVITSATLQVAGSFSFLTSRLGAEAVGERLHTLQLDSPFDFERQACLACPVDAPDPGQPAFEDWLAGALLRLISASRGATLVLFTAWGTMTRTYGQIREALADMEIEALCQGQAPRDKLLNRFRLEQSAVLFGTDSFWQGVDVIGPSLRQVIITRLPFDVPSEPLFQARSEQLSRQGQNPFSALALPRAVLRLKQGFGRLIRSGADRGAVVLLDRRVFSRTYGHRFLQSLPPARRLDGTLDDLCDSLRIFLAEDGSAPAPPSES